MTRFAASCLLLTCGALALWGGAVSAQAAQDADAGELVVTLAATERQLEQLEGELAAVGASLASALSTSSWLAQRIDQFSAQSAALSMGEEVVRLTGLSARLADIDDRRAAVQPAVAAAQQGYETLRAAVLTALVAPADDDGVARLSQLEEFQGQALVQRDALRSASQAGDAMVRDVCRINIEVEGVRTALAALRGEVGEDGSDVLTAPSWLDAEPVVELSTSQGLLVLALRPDVAPRHVENFRRLVAEGFYDGLTMHRVVPGFVIQGGDPLGTGMGGPGWQIPAEFNDLAHLRGTLSMARMGQWDTAGSQFFLCLGDWSQQLDHKYTVFGKVLRGLATLDNIEALGSASGVPSETVIIHKAVLRERRPLDVSDER